MNRYENYEREGYGNPSYVTLRKEALGKKRSATVLNDEQLSSLEKEDEPF